MPAKKTKKTTKAKPSLKRSTKKKTSAKAKPSLKQKPMPSRVDVPLYGSALNKIAILISHPIFTAAFGSATIVAANQAFNELRNNDHDLVQTRSTLTMVRGELEKLKAQLAKPLLPELNSESVDEADGELIDEDPSEIEGNHEDSNLVEEDFTSEEATEASPDPEPQIDEDAEPDINDPDDRLAMSGYEEGYDAPTNGTDHSD